MFDKDMQIKGKHATYWKALTLLPGNAKETSSNFKIFENYIYVYMVAPIIGLINNRKGHIDPNDNNKDTAGMLAEVQIKNLSKLKFIYRLIILMDESENLSQEEKINRAFRYDEENNPEDIKRGINTFTEYFLGGLEVLYEEFVEKCITEDDYITRMYEFLEEFKDEQNITSEDLDINSFV